MGTLAPVASHASMNGMNWVPVNPNEEAIVGKKYRLTQTVRAPYTSKNIEKLEQSLRYGVGFKNLTDWRSLNEKISITRFVAHYPTGGAAGTPTWKFEMEFTKTSKGSPLLVIIGIVALIVTLSILASVVGSTIEKEADKVKDVAGATVFNPFFLIAAVIVVLAITGANLKGMTGGK